MDPVTMIAVPGLIGGIVVALAMVVWQRRQSERPTLRLEREGSGPPPADVINAARIRVAGVGGLGMVAMAVIVAVALPSVRTPLLAGLALGVILAVGLILLRRRTGSLPSGGRHSGAHSVVPLESRPGDGDPAVDGQPRHRGIEMRPVARGV
jgi:hypothetical protein